MRFLLIRGLTVPAILLLSIVVAFFSVVAKAGARVRELSGGILRCACCGRALNATHQRRTLYDGYLNYYRCGARNSHGPDVCPRTPGLRAERTEQEVYQSVQRVIDDKELIVREIQAGFERRRQELSGPGMDAGALAKKLDLIDARWVRYQEAYAADAMSVADLKARRAELDEERQEIERQIQDARTRDEQLETLDIKQSRILACANLRAKNMDV